jgi:UDP-N-acetylglucosamine--N-acetylmuramyl-(pentapeptide) pyrophosphoryl-undecaprenol N-acetylglucosamine transferase
MRLLVSAGGTGGHLFPAMSVIDELRRAGEIDELLFLGRRHGIERDTVTAAGIEYRGVTTAPWPTGISLRAVTSTVRNVAGILEAARLLRSFKPDIVFTTGGYVSLPTALAAGLSHIPLVIHEQNRYPGRANRLAARYATRIALSTEETPKGFSSERTVHVGTPVRRDLLGDRPDPAEARTRFGLDPHRFTLLVFGGSQGAQSINRAVAAALDHIDPESIQILIATGETTFDEMSRACDPSPVRTEVRPFIDDMCGALACADLVVSRSGASTLAEIAVMGLPSILVPYPHATGGHQQENAEQFEAKGAAKVILDSDLDGPDLAGAITAIATDSTTRTAMAQAARTLARPDAASRIAELLKILANT